MNDFLPADYEMPTESNYMQFEDGKNKFRVLSKAVIGMMYWKTVDGKRKPIRKRMGEQINQAELEKNKWGNTDKPKHFWAFVVWNYSSKRVQILEVTQKTVMGSIRNLIEDEDWGDVKSYDLVVIKTGKDLETQYAVNPSPKKDIDPGVIAEFKALNINLDALFTGDDPFGAEVATEVINPDDIPF